MENQGPRSTGGIRVARRAAASTLVLVLGVLLSFAGGAQAARLHDGRRVPRWGGFTTRQLEAHEARLGRRAAVKPALAGTGSIEGTVRDAVEGTGIEGIEVCAYPNEELEEEDFFEEEAPTCARSRAGGHYTIGDLAEGEYDVEFSTPFNSTLDYITQYYEEAETFLRAVPIEVASGETVTGINAALKKGGEVEGRVTRAVGGTGIEGIEVCAWGAGAASCAETEAGGAYVITGLPSGSYRVGFRTSPGSGQNYVTQFYDDEASFEDANPIAVKVKEKIEAIDAAMVVGGEIKGTVTNGETGLPETEAVACAVGESEEEVGCALTNGSGEYTIEGLASGSYTVFFLFAEVNAPEFYNLVFNESEATKVGVTAPGVTRGIDAESPTRPSRIVAPHVTGDAVVGGVLTCEEGTYSAVPAPTITVQWLRNGEAIAGATSATYTVQAADAGQQLQCMVTATNLVGWRWVKTAGIPIPVPAPAAVVTPPAGGVLPSITVVPLLSVASRVTTPHHRAAVRLKCSGAPCKGTLQLLMRVVVHHRATTIVLATGSFSLQAGASSSVPMHLTAAGRSRLAHDSHRAVAAKLKLSLHGGLTSTHAVSVI